MGRGHVERKLVRPSAALALGIALLLILPAAAFAVLGDFTEPSSSPEPVGKTSESVVAGDFNEDGHADLVVSNKDSNDLTVLLNDGHGDFTPVASSPTVTGPWQVVAAKLNADAHLDLAVASQTAPADGVVAILLGDGTGNFTPAPTSPVPIGAVTRNLAAADLDGDGDQDLAVAKLFPAAVAILLNAGSANFTQPGTSPEDAGGNATNVTSVVTGDFNEDHATDIAAGSEFSNEIRIYLNDGDEDGDFTGTSPISGIDGTAMTSGLFDADGAIDLAIGEGGSKKAAILLGNGSGGFAAAPTSPEELPGEVRWLVSADFNNDSKPDLAATGGGSPGFAGVLLGNGAGDFTGPTSSPEVVGSFPTSIAAAPLNGDASVDLAVANTFGEKANVLLNDFVPESEPPAEKESQPSSPLVTPPASTLPAPNTKLGVHPGPRVTTKLKKLKVKFGFASDVAGATFECKLDKGSFKPCKSPATFQVKPGKHTFKVRAVASGGADASPVTYKFKVVKQKG
ncbi:MAG: FG-GAP repeat domain-containing protein [Solirubrobacterales bacterium]